MPPSRVVSEVTQLAEVIAPRDCWYSTTSNVLHPFMFCLHSTHSLNSLNFVSPSFSFLVSSIHCSPFAIRLYILFSFSVGLFTTDFPTTFSFILVFSAPGPLALCSLFSSRCTKFPPPRRNEQRAISLLLNACHKSLRAPHPFAHPPIDHPRIHSLQLSSTLQPLLLSSSSNISPRFPFPLSLFPYSATDSSFLFNFSFCLNFSPFLFYLFLSNFISIHVLFLIDVFVLII